MIGNMEHSDKPKALSREVVTPVHTQKSLGDEPGVRMILPVGRSGWAIAAGYLGLFGLLVFPAPLALGVSLIAIRDINRSQKTDKKKYGMGRAVFGLIVGSIGSVVLAAGVLF